MAVDIAPGLTRVRKFAAKIETTTGTLETLAAADAVTRLFEPNIAFNFETTERPTNDLTPQGNRIAARPATVTFGNELTSAATLPDWTKFLRGCGYGDSGTAKVFKPVEGATTTLTMGRYRNGETKYAVGCMGTATIRLTAGQVARADWTFNGVAEQVTDDTLSTITYDNTAPLTVGAVTFSVGTGPQLVVPEVTIDLGNTVVPRRDVTAFDSADYATGIRAYYITAFNPIVRINPEALPIDDRNWFNLHQTYADLSMTIELGSGSNRLIITATLRVNESPQEADDNGINRHDIVLAGVGANPLTLDFRAAS